MKLLTAVCGLSLLPATLFALPSADNRPAPLTKETPASPAPVEAAAKPLADNEFIWQQRTSTLHHGEANRRLLEGLGRCSQFAVETRAEADRTVHDIFFRVGENRSPWPIGRIALKPLAKGSQIALGQNKQFSMGVGKLQKMWGDYLDEQYACPPKPGKHSGGMQHP